MPIIRVGRDNIAALISGAGTAWGTASYMVVASSTGGHSPASTWFSPTGAAFSCMEATYPLRAANILQYRGLYATDEANFEWNQWGVANATSTSAGELLLMSNQSCFIQKTNQQSVQFTTCVTITT